jgi:uncharacterized membrane protein YcjF (UPF0283 family)
MEQAELMKWLHEAAENAGEFVQREAPLVANEIVAWSFWSNVVGCVEALIALALMVSIASWGLRNWKKANYGDSFFAVPSTLGIVLSLLITFLPLSMCLSNAVKAAVAPRVVIIEYIRGASK